MTVTCPNRTEHALSRTPSLTPYSARQVGLLLEAALQTEPRVLSEVRAVLTALERVEVTLAEARGDSPSTASTAPSGDNDSEGGRWESLRKRAGRLQSMAGSLREAAVAAAAARAARQVMADTIASEAGALTRAPGEAGAAFSSAPAEAAVASAAHRWGEGGAGGAHGVDADTQRTLQQLGQQQRKLAQWREHNLLESSVGSRLRAHEYDAASDRIIVAAGELRAEAQVAARAAAGHEGEARVLGAAVEGARQQVRAAQSRAAELQAAHQTAQARAAEGAWRQLLARCGEQEGAAAAAHEAGAAAAGEQRRAEGSARELEEVRG